MHITFVFNWSKVINMSVLLKQLVGSIISSYLGPIKSNKVVLDCEDCTMVKCPLEFLKKIAIKDPFSSLLENTLDSHHEQFGCSTMSLLAMWQLWQEEFKLAMEEGCEVQDIIEFSQKTLADVVSALSEVIIDCDKTCLSKLQITKNTSIHLNQPSFQNKKNTKSALVKTYNVPKELSSLGSVSIGYSSRHFSPFSSKSEEKSVNDFEKLTGEKNGDNLISVTSEMRKEMHSLVEKLSHGERDFIDLICNLWIQQVQSRNSLEFTINGICICPATLPCSNCTVVDGIIINSNLSLLYEQDLGSFENCRALIIKGSILFEYVHLGYVSKVSITLKETTESLKISQKDEWIEKCCKLLMELQINVLLVNGEVDSSILSFCSAHSILVLPSVPWKTLEILCISVHQSPCTYLIDCDEDNIVTNLVVKKWDFVSSKMLVHGEYYHIDTVKVCKTMKPQTLILCHPSEPVLKSLEHQFWHIASRLHLALKSNQLLPGGGKTEKFCYDSIMKHSPESMPERRVRKGVANGFLNYFKIISCKKDIIQKVKDRPSFDEATSKFQAWQSAMSLVLSILQCDYFIINDSDSQIVKELDMNVIGFL